MIQRPYRNLRNYAVALTIVVMGCFSLINYEMQSNTYYMPISSPLKIEYEGRASTDTAAQIIDPELEEHLRGMHNLVN
ncbi:MAG: hypothetical protein U9O94_04515 [Nanoarchaeota archaeon]|nr:hypothetical protein [Nanoarchaeota archaeon]